MDSRERGRSNQIDSELIDMIARRSVRRFRGWCEGRTPVELAENLEALESSEERLIYFRMLTTSVASEVFTSLEKTSQSELIANFTSKEINTIVEELYTDELVDIIEEMPSAISKKIYRGIKNPEERRVVNRLLKYNDDQVGSIMAVNLV